MKYLIRKNVLTTTLLTLAFCVGSQNLFAATSYQDDLCHSDTESHDDNASPNDDTKHTHEETKTDVRVNCDKVRVKNDEELEKMKRYVESYIPKETIVTDLKLPSQR